MKVLAVRNKVVDMDDAALVAGLKRALYACAGYKHNPLKPDQVLASVKGYYASVLQGRLRYLSYNDLSIDVHLIEETAKTDIRSHKLFCKLYDALESYLSQGISTKNESSIKQHIRNIFSG